MKELGIGVLLQLEDDVGEAGVEAQHVALFDFDFVLVDNFHQFIVGDGVAPPRKMVVQIDHHAAALRAVLGKVLDAERARLRSFVLRPGLACCVLRRGPHVRAGAKAVVEHDLALAVAIGIETAADMRKRVPLRRVLQREEHQVVADDVGEVRILRRQRETEILLA